MDQFLQLDISSSEFKNSKEFPTKTVSQINLNSNDLYQIKKKATFKNSNQEAFVTKQSIPFHQSSLQHETQKFSLCNYLIDPNKFRFKFIVRIMAHVLKYVKILRHRVHTRRHPTTKTTNNDVQQNEAYHLTDDEIEETEIYF